METECRIGVRHSVIDSPFIIRHSSFPMSARDRFLALLSTALREGTLTKLTLGKYRGRDAMLQNLFVRPVTLKSGLHFAFVWRHATRDITKNHPPAEALALLESLMGRDFLDAHLFTTTSRRWSRKAGARWSWWRTHCFPSRGWRRS